MAMKLIIVAVFELNCADVDAFQTFRSRSKIYYCLWLIFRLHNIFYRDLSFILGKYEVPSCYWQIMDSWLPCHDIMIEYNNIPVYQIKIFTMITSQLGHVKENLGNTKLNTSCFLLLYNILTIYIIIYLNIRRVVFIFSNLLLEYSKFYKLKTVNLNTKWGGRDLTVSDQLLTVYKLYFLNPLDAFLHIRRLDKLNIWFQWINQILFHFVQF